MNAREIRNLKISLSNIYSALSLKSLKDNIGEIFISGDVNENRDFVLDRGEKLYMTKFTIHLFSVKTPENMVNKNDKLYFTSNRITYLLGLHF